MDEREAALADSPAISGNLESQAVTCAQLRKLQELRQRRLHLKRASEQDCRGKKRRLPASAKHKGKQAKEKQASNSEIATQFCGNFDHFTSSVQKPDEVVMENHNVADNTERPPTYVKKRQKLRWGLDTKERWERKGNM